MAFTKVTLTGAKDVIKAAFTKVNDLIDDLLSTGNGLGASQVGIEDTAGNMAAANVEDALAEIYTDTASARGFADNLDENPGTTTGLTWGYKAGKVRSDNKITTVSAGTVGLFNNATNYIEIDEYGTVTISSTGFTQGKVPLRTITTSGGIQTVSTDSRAFVSAVGFRIINFVIDDGTNANTLSLSSSNIYNGKILSTENNLSKGGSTTSFSLDGSGYIIDITAAALDVTTGNGLFAVVANNNSTTAVNVVASRTGTKLRLIFTNAATGAVVDLTSLVDTGLLQVVVFYIDNG